jgi:hypothetical protein
MVCFPIQARARPFDFKAGNVALIMEKQPHFKDTQDLVFMNLKYNNLSNY